MKKTVRLTENILRGMVRKAISEELSRTGNIMLKEYHEQLRIPFEEYGNGHAFIDEFIDWIQYASEKGTLPKPSITWEEGLKKGWDEYTAKGKSSSWKTYDDFRKFVKSYEKSGFIEFDENGNLYVERSITINIPYGDINSEDNELYGNQIRDYEKNIGGCWAVGHSNSKAYCGNYYDDTGTVIIKGYMFLDDIYWEEFVRLWDRESSEFEIRTYPNGRVMLTEIQINKKILKPKDFDGPRILKSTFFGNNIIFNGNFAKLGYEQSNYDKSFIDRQGNEYTTEEFLKKIVDFLKNGYDLGDMIDFYSDYDDDPTMICVWGKYHNFIDKDKNLLLPDRWFDYCSTFKHGKAIIEFEEKFNLIDRNGNILFEPNNQEEWFDDIENALNYNSYYSYILRKGNQMYFITKDDEFMNYETAINLFMNKGGTLEKLFGYDCINKISDGGLYSVDVLDLYSFLVHEDGTLANTQLFDNINNYSNGFAKVITLNRKFNFIDKNGDILYEPDEPDEWFEECDKFDKDGFARVHKYNKYNLLDTNGNIVYEPERPSEWFDSINSIKLNRFYVVEDNDKQGLNFISKDDGRLLFPNTWFCSFRRANRWDDDSDDCIVEYGGKYNLMNGNGNLVYEPNNPEKWFDGYKICYSNVIAVSINNRWNYMDFNGNILYEPNNPKKWFDNCNGLYNRFFIVTINGVQYAIDKNGNFYDCETNQQISPPTGNNTTNESILRLKNKIRHFVNEAIRRYTNKADL